MAVRERPHEITTRTPKAIPAELLALYADGMDKWWCSDWDGKEHLLTAIGLGPLPGDRGDGVLLSLLRTLPPVTRWVIEMRTGVWCGRHFPDDWKWIGKYAGGIGANAAEALYVSGLALLNAEAAARGLETVAIRPRMTRDPATVARPEQRARFAILKRDGYRCRLCGRGAGDGIRLEVDHIKPLSRGGSNEEGNLWALCEDCNRGKGSEEL